MGIFRYDWAIVVDLEATCWANGLKPADEEQDIIEVGVCEVDLVNKRLGKSASIVVKPLRSKVTPYCTTLTGWTQEAVDKGETLLHASQQLQSEFSSRERLWVSQGDFDRITFVENCSALGVPYPFSKRHLNIACVYSLLTGKKKQSGMMRELTELGLDHEGRHHSGVDDAKNIARIFLEVLNRGHIKI